MKKNKFGGYFTVEAVFIVPIVICVLALLCYMGLFMCNRCMLLQDTYILGVEGSTTDGMSNSETVSYILSHSKAMLSKYYGVSQMDKKVQVGMRELSVELRCEMKVPFAFFSWEEEKMSGIWKLNERKKLDRTEPVKFIRACRKAEKLLD